MTTKTEWIARYLGNPAEWQVDQQGVIRDTVRPLVEQVVGHVTRKDSLAIIRWTISGGILTLPDWNDQ